MAELTEPPRMAGLIYWLLSPAATRDAKLGDMNEVFFDNQRAHGRRTAVRLYWWDVLRSIGPILLDVVLRITEGVIKLIGP